MTSPQPFGCTERLIDLVEDATAGSFETEGFAYTTRDFFSMDRAFSFDHEGGQRGHFKGL